jgi:hypothetical protein
MGLRERRLAEQIKTTDFADFKKDLDAVTKTPIEVDVDWDTFILYDEYPLSRLRSNVFSPIQDTFASLCQDEMGKEAVAESIKKITITHVDDLDKIDTNLSGGTLAFTVKLNDPEWRLISAYDLTPMLENRL